MGQQGLDELEALAVLALQRGLFENADHVGRVFDALGRVRQGLGVAQKWVAWVSRSEEEQTQNWKALNG